MIAVSNLAFSFGPKAVFSALNLTVRRGEILSLLGPNGCGKSTLLRLLRGNLRANGGQITWAGIPVSEIPAAIMARKVAVVPQGMQASFPFKVKELVAMGRYPHRKNLLSFADREDQRVIRRALAMTDIIGLAERPVTRLSGGELQRVLLARALAQEAETLFLDEATSHLDIDHRLELSELLVRLNRELGTTIVQVSHDLDLAAAMSQRILLLNGQGEIAAEGAPGAVMTAENLRRVFRVDVKVEENPYTGAPQIHPLLSGVVPRLETAKIHLICGGGSGTTLLRRLHLAAAELSAGPLNEGDSDEVLATALGIPLVRELPFSPYSPTALEETAAMVDRAEILIIATQWWGAGNLACLELAETALKKGKTVYLLGTERGRDYTDGDAEKKIAILRGLGARSVENEELLLERLGRKAL
ncbi:MAG: ABC transporter [Desulfuromonas sp.]|nr:MAG: ABC transporter [Desulfuromonas sp.]